ncbi:MAG: sodium:calcium antiporter [Candidatus Bathyarchaeota archaeon]|nr:sodium:calcium antiporter [Candidatus Bathyarchaeota archaeon]
MAIEFGDLIVNILIISASFVVLNYASSLTIGNAVKVATATRLGKTAVGFSLLAFSTSLPELTVAVNAALSGGAPISVGNALGSNIVNICVVVGLAALVLFFKRKKMPSASNLVPEFAKSELNSIYFGLLVSSMIPLVLIYISEATWVVGFILISIFVVYMYNMSKVRLPTDENSEATPSEGKSKLKRYGLLTIVGALGVVASAHFLVDSAVSIAQGAGIPQTVIGATIIAFGTSLPELTIDLKAFSKGQSALAFGDIIGSSFVNITLILGITLFVPALIGTPIVMNMAAYQNLVIFSIITNLFFWYFISQGKLTWREGALFLIVYALFLITTLGAM